MQLKNVHNVSAGGVYGGEINSVRLAGGLFCRRSSQNTKPSGGSTKNCAIDFKLHIYYF